MKKQESTWELMELNDGAGRQWCTNQTQGFDPEVALRAIETLKRLRRACHAYACMVEDGVRIGSADYDEALNEMGCCEAEADEVLERIRA